MNSNFWRAVSLLAGTTIGAGIFGIPYVTAQSGYLIGLLWLVVLAAVTWVVNLLYGRIVLATKGDHQLTGYAQVYLGRAGYLGALLALLVGQYGALLAYTIGTGDFLAVIFPNRLTPFFFSLIFFIVGAGVVYKGIRLIASLEGVIVLLMTGLVLVLALVGAPQVNSAHFAGWTSDFKELILPYGVLFTALAGYVVVPEMVELLKTKRRRLLVAVSLGTLIPFLLYLLFQWVVVGVSGAQTSQEAIAGLAPFFPPIVVKLGALFGILAMSSSFLTLALVLREMYENDFGLSQKQSLSLTLLPALILFLLGARSFVMVLSVSGTLMGTLTVLLILAIYLKLRYVKIIVQ